MKRINPALHQELRKTANHVVLGWLLTRPDGYELGFTSGDVTFELDGVRYEPTNAFSGMAATAKSNLAVDNTSTVALISDKITEWDLQAGIWDNSRVRMFWVDPNQPELGTVPIKGGRMGEIIIRNGQFETELRAVMQRLQQPFGDFYTLECRADLGDHECKVWLAADPWIPGERYIAKAGADAGIGSYVRPVTQNGYWYQCISAQSEAAEVVSHPRTIRSNDKFNFERFVDENKGTPQVLDIMFIMLVLKEMEKDPNYQPQTTLEKRIITQYGLWDDMSRVAEEGREPFGGSFYQVTTLENGQMVNSVAYLTPTKEGKVPLSAPAGVQPLSLTNTSSSVVYKVGLSGATEPVWPTVEGVTIADNQLVWKTIRARRLVGAVTAVFSRSHFSDRSRDEPYDYWRYGVVTWLSGKNKGIKVEVRGYSNDNGGGFSLLEQMPGEIVPGDEYEVVAGCAKTRLACKGFDNIHNFRGYPDMPTEEKALATANIVARGGKKKQDSGGS